MNKKKLLLINFEGLPFGYSASINKIRLMGEILSKSNFDVYCLNKRTSSNPRNIGFHRGIRFTFFNNNEKSHNIIKRLFKFFYAHIKELLFVNKIKSKYNDKYILIHYNWFPIFIYYWVFSKLLNFKIIVNIMEWHLATPSRNLFEKINKNLFDKLSFKMASGAIPISKYIDNKIHKINKSLPTFILPAITNFDLIKTIDKGNNYFNDYILYCGNLGYLEVINFIIKSYSKTKNRNVKLFLIVNGNKGEFDELKRIINKFGIQKDVIVNSNLSFKKLIVIYKNALALLIPIRNTDQDLARFPQKISEYVATERPIITTGFGIVNDYFDDKSAFISIEYCTDEYAKIIDKATSNPENATRVGINGYNIGYKKLNTKSFDKTLPKFLINI